MGTPAESASLKRVFRLKPGKRMPDAQETTGPRILLVEDDADIARLVTLHLRELAGELHHCSRGDDALRTARDQHWDLLVLDLRLPGLGGLDICRRLREHGRHTPILMLTAKSGELDRVLGLELGADDYLTKPFSPLELTARVRALLRRSTISQQNDAHGTAGATDASPVTVGPFSICRRSHSVSLHGEPVALTSREFDLLLHFARQPGRVFRRSELLDEVWGYGHDGYEHTVNTHINRLRRKIEQDPGNPAYVITVWGVGYRFQAGT